MVPTCNGGTKIFKSNQAERSHRFPLSAPNTTHLIPCVALVVAGVAATDGDDLVERLRGEVGYEGAVLQPSVFRLRVACGRTQKG